MNAQTRHKLEWAVGLLGDLLKDGEELELTTRRRLEESRRKIVTVLRSSPADGSFWSWLDQQKNRRDKVGELARLAARDKQWPREDGAGLRAYVERLELVNLTEGVPVWRGKYGPELVDKYLYPAWEEYLLAARSPAPRSMGAAAE